MTESLAGPLRGLLKWTRVQAVASVLTAAAGLGTAVTIYSATLPQPALLLKSTFHAPYERDPPKDPKGEIELRNHGGSPMLVKQIRVLCHGQPVDSFASVLAGNKCFRLSTQSESLERLSQQGRLLKHDSSILLATVRPTDEHAAGLEWEAELRRRFASDHVEVEVEFEYLHLPLYGPALRGKKVCKLQ